MKQVIFLIFIFSVRTFSQSIDLGDLKHIKNTYADKNKKELYVFYSNDSLSIIDLVSLKEKSKTKITYPEQIFELIFRIVSFDSRLHFLSPNGGLVYRLDRDSIVRIDKSFDHKMQVNSAIFTNKDTIYRYGGYGFWSNRNFFTYYNKTSKDWKMIPPTGSTSLPKGSQYPNVTCDEDDFYVYGGITTEEFNPLNFDEYNEVWKFNRNNRSWDNLGEFEYKLTEFIYNIPYKNNHIFINDNNTVYLVNVVNNQLKTYERSPFQQKIIASLDSFYLDGDFYLFTREDNNKNDVKLITINEDSFFGEMIDESNFYTNNEKTYYTIGVLFLIVLSIPVYKKIEKETRNRNKITLEKDKLIFKKRILPFDEIRVSIIRLLLTSTKEVPLHDIMDIYDNKELNYGHNTRVIKTTLEEINFFLKSILEIKEDLITSKKSDLDKRIKVYSIDKSYFYVK
tara:strand:+ start:6333 stop:7688 length:1356 start_codon:yes stop_codon:yes gene_type:complete